jgi:hypothetical protein
LTPIEAATDEQIEAVVAVKIKGTLFGCQLAALLLADRGLLQLDDAQLAAAHVN